MESSDSNVTSRNQFQLNTISICHCGKKTKVTKSWTNENPGRRFLRCTVHGFVSWYDEEKPGGWQKTMLLEARDEISNLKEMIRNLKNGRNIGSSSNMVDDNEETQKQLEKNAKEVIKLQNEVLLGKEREKLLRQFCVISWGGFIATTAAIIILLK